MNEFQSRHNIVCFSLFILLIATLCFVWNDAVLTWPAIDNLPAAKRLLDGNFLANDFFTNASSETSPRTPFIYILVILQYIFGGFERTYLFLKLLCVLNPLLYYIVISRSLKNVYGSENYLFISFSVVFSIIFLQCSLVRFLIVAWWPPIWFNPNPQNIAIALSLIGIIFSKSKLVSIMLIAAATIIHPAVSFLNVSFLLLINSDTFTRSKAGPYLSPYTGIFLGVAIVKLYFYSSYSLESGRFSEIYIFGAHPYHYLPSRFGTFSRFSWYWGFAFNLIPLAIISAYLWIEKSPYKLNCLIATMLYAVTPAIQYVFVEKYKFNFFSAFGISRFLMYGPWLVCFFFSASIFQYVSVQKYRWIDGIQHKLKSLISFKLNMLLVLSSVLLTVLYVRDVPYWNKYSDSIEGVQRFAIFETNNTDIFMLPFSMPRAEFPLITNRAIFFGNGFPFNAKFFEEYNERQIAIESNGFETHFYRLLGPNDFVSISKKFDIDHIVIESEFSSNFKNCEYEYSNKEYKIYSLRALMRCAEDVPSLEK